MVSRLRGLSIFQESNTAFGLNTQALDQMLDTLDCIQLCAHMILISTCAELRQFCAFSAWLQHEIEVQSTESHSLGAEELESKDLMFDYPEILSYIQGAMQQSHLYQFLRSSRLNDENEAPSMISSKGSIYGLYKQCTEAFQVHPVTDADLPGLEELFHRLNEQYQVVASKMAETQKRKLGLGDVMPLVQGDIRCMDMRMISDVSYSGRLLVKAHNNNHTRTLNNRIPLKHTLQQFLLLLAVCI